MRHRSAGPAGVPLRALAVALILAGLGLWQAWNCTDGTMMISPMSATTLSHDTSTGDLTEAEQAASDQEAPDTPAGMAGLCVTVLASVAAAVVLTSPSLRLLGSVRRPGELVIRRVEMSVRAPVLTRLSVSRT